MTTELASRRVPAMAMGSLSDPKELGTMLAASHYFEDAKDAAQAVVKVLAGQELGFGPIASMTGVFIVKGRVTLSANLMAASIKRHPKYDFRVKDLTDDRASVAFFEAGKEVGTSDFTMEDARKAGLANQDNWRKYPRNMLFARALSNGAKWFCPDVFAGAPVYTPDELGVEIDAETGEILEGTIATVTTEPSKPAEPSEPEPASNPPEAAPASAGADAADAMGEGEEKPASAAPSDENRQVTDEEVAALTEYLNALHAPDSFRTFARMAFGAADFKALSVGQARTIMNEAKERAAQAGWKAAAT